MSNPTAPTPAPPEWLADLANQIASRIEPIDELAAVSCHFSDAGDCWEISLFIAATEQIGGANDGQRLHSRFAFDLLDATSVLDVVEQFYWQPLTIGLGDEVGPHIAIIGQYEGRAVWIRVLSEPGERFDLD